MDNEIQRREDLLKVKCLKSFLVSDGQVWLERFGKIIDIFGPLSQGPVLLAKVSILEIDIPIHNDSLFYIFMSIN